MAELGRLHIVKKDNMPMWKSLVVRICAIIAALVVVGVLSVALIHENPFSIFGALIKGAFIDVNTLLQNTSLLLMFGLAVVPAFKMKYWNMGANGQVLMGCLAAIACMKFIPLSAPAMPNWLLIAISLVASIAAATIWSVIPAIFKAQFNTNETLFTLMMNYIAIGIVDYFVFLWDKSGSGSIGIVNLLTGKQGWIPDVFGNKYNLSIICGLVLAVIMFIYIRFTKHGFEVSLVGESVNTAKYVGINVKKVIIRSLAFCGIICGILGMLYAGNVSHTVNTSVGGLGFTAILIAWLGGFDPLVMIVTSFFVEFLETGSQYVSAAFQLNSNDFANIVVGIIFFFIIGSEFFIRYSIKINKHSKNEEDKA